MNSLLQWTQHCSHGFHGSRKGLYDQKGENTQKNLGDKRPAKEADR